MSRTRQFLVPLALGATGFLALAVCGCRKEGEKPPALPANSPAVYMNDPEFRRQLADKRHELQAILREREPLAARMEALVKEHGEDLAALQKISEWTNLYAKVTELNAKYEAVRRRQLSVVKRRLAPAEKEISK